jgi:hypothetical protein
MNIVCILQSHNHFEKYLLDKELDHDQSWDTCFPQDILYNLLNLLLLCSIHCYKLNTMMRQTNPDIHQDCMANYAVHLYNNCLVDTDNSCYCLNSNHDCTMLHSKLIATNMQR